MKSISLRVALFVVITQIVMLTITGALYFNNFNNAANERLREQAELPLLLLNDGVLEFDVVSDTEEVRQIVGDELLNAFIVGINDNIFFSANPEFIGQPFSTLEEFEGLNVRQLSAPIITQDSAGNVISAAPLTGADGRSVRFFAVLEISNAQAIANRNQLALIFLIGGVITVVTTSFVIWFVFNRLVFQRIIATQHTLNEVTLGNLAARVADPNEDEIGRLQHDANTTIARLEEVVNTLEERVAERTRDLETSANVSSQIATILDPTQLLQQLAELTADAFNFYQVRLFTFNAEDETLKLVAASKHMGNQTPYDNMVFNLFHAGLVPKAASERRQIVNNDVARDDAYIPNSLFPDTKSEAAIPIMYGNELLGVLDLQSSAVNRFQKTNLQLYRAFADQIAISIRNARLFEEVEIARLQAEQANNAKSSFLASTSHELRTPLNAIINLTSFVRRGAMGPVTDKQREVLTLVWQSGQHLLSLINDVLDMSKIESGSLKLYLEPDVDLQAIIGDAKDITIPLIGDKPIELKTDISPQLPTLTADKHRIKQILLNLLSNAAKFTDEGEICIKATPHDQSVVISVSDTGSGIAAVDIERVFEKFVQTETGLRQGAGTGLGMPITKSLVEAHGGRIWLESEFGVGTTFHVQLPITLLTQEKTSSVQGAQEK